MIAIVGGTGPEGSGLALRWARAGEQIVIGSRDACARASRRRRDCPEVGRTRKRRRSGECCRSEDVRRRCADRALRRTSRDPQATQAVISSGHSSHRRNGAAGHRRRRTPHPHVGRVARLRGRASRRNRRQECLSGRRLSQPLGQSLLDSDHDVDCDVIVCSDDDRARQVASELS